MSPIKQVLIVTDGSPALSKVAATIQKSMAELRFVVRNAAEFTPVDILPADAYFFGCEKAKPASFAELERVLKGVNLAGRPCGLFSSASNEAIDYLRTMVRDSELRQHPVPLLASASPDVGAWAAETLR